MFPAINGTMDEDEEASSLSDASVKIIPIEVSYKKNKLPLWTKEVIYTSPGYEDEQNLQLVRGGVKFRLLSDVVTPEERRSFIGKIEMLSEIAQDVGTGEKSTNSTTADLKAHFMDTLSLQAAGSKPRPKVTKRKVIKILGSIKGYKNFVRNPVIPLRKAVCLVKYIRAKGYHIGFAPPPPVVKSGKRKNAARKDSKKENSLHEELSRKIGSGLPSGSSLASTSSGSSQSSVASNDTPKKLRNL